MLRKKPEFFCPICFKSIDDNLELIEHNTLHFDKQPFKCDFCNFRSENRSLLEYHNRFDHNVNESYRCIYCLLEYPSKSSLIIHNKYSTEFHFLCDVCNFRTCSKTVMKKHKRLHDGIPCSFLNCSYVSFSEQQIEEHDKLHLKETRRYVCSLCNESFKNINLLESHKHIPASEIFHKCNHCDHKCALLKSMNDHYEVFHKNKIYVPPKQKAENLNVEPNVSLLHEKVNLQSNSDFEKSSSKCPVSNCPNSNELVNNQVVNKHVPTTSSILKRPQSNENIENNSCCPNPVGNSAFKDLVDKNSDESIHNLAIDHDGPMSKKRFALKESLFINTENSERNSYFSKSTLNTACSEVLDLSDLSSKQWTNNLIGGSSDSHTKSKSIGRFFQEKIDKSEKNSWCTKSKSHLTCQDLENFHEQNSKESDNLSVDIDVSVPKKPLLKRFLIQDQEKSAKNSSCFMSTVNSACQDDSELDSDDSEHDLIIDLDEPKSEESFLSNETSLSMNNDGFESQPTIMMNYDLQNIKIVNALGSSLNSFTGSKIFCKEINISSSESAQHYSKLNEQKDTYTDYSDQVPITSKARNVPKHRIQRLKNETLKQVIDGNEKFKCDHCYFSCNNPTTFKNHFSFCHKENHSNLPSNTLADLLSEKSLNILPVDNTDECIDSCLQQNSLCTQETPFVSNITYYKTTNKQILAHPNVEQRVHSDPVRQIPSYAPFSVLCTSNQFAVPGYQVNVFNSFVPFSGQLQSTGPYSNVGPPDPFNLPFGVHTQNLVSQTGPQDIDAGTQIHDLKHVGQTVTQQNISQVSGFSDNFVVMCDMATQTNVASSDEDESIENYNDCRQDVSVQTDVTFEL